MWVVYGAVLPKDTFLLPGSQGMGQGVAVVVTDLVVFLPDQVFSVVLFGFQLAQSLVVFFADGL